MPPLNLDLSTLKPKKLRAAAHLFYELHDVRAAASNELADKLAAIADECPPEIAERITQAVTACRDKANAALEAAKDGLALIAGRAGRTAPTKQPDAA